MGDVHAALRERPSIIGIVDGGFEDTPAIWHDEILAALDAGIPVLGAASIGALRAAELDRFGMQGVGRIYGWFRDGILEDDDEVAVLHAPPELDFQPLTLPMVNVRATVEALVARGELDDDPAGAVLASAKSIFYKRRTFQSLAQDLGASFESIVARLEAGYVDQKRQDGVALLKLMLSPRGL